MEKEEAEVFPKAEEEEKEKVEEEATSAKERAVENQKAATSQDSAIPVESLDIMNHNVGRKKRTLEE